MIVMGNLLIALGAVGIWESTFGNAGIAWAMSLLKRKSKPVSPVADDTSALDRPIRLELLIPAHNEEKLIQQTLTSLEHAKELFALRSTMTSGIRHTVQTCVGLDHCTDRTDRVVQNWATGRGVKIRITKNYNTPCKWNILQQMVKSSQADWVALVDSGSVWEEGLLAAIFPLLKDPDLMAIAPSYRPAKAGILDRLNWRLERSLKSLESAAGGPVSVHGATVFYRRDVLLEAFEALQAEQWLNDDVVIPLWLRTRYPERKIHYLSKTGADADTKEAWVRDYGIRASLQVEYGRRKRMLLGNLQWIRNLYLNAWKSDAAVGLLAARRVFRTFWAYWVLALGTGIALHAIHYLQPSISNLVFAASAIVLLASIPRQGSLQRLRAAFFAGLELPYHWLTAARRTQEKIWN